ncbi:MAG TPA: 1-deoxy-D-xylulose-5-phosphate reductoisomerase [Actinomycetota bacterium]|nr:1-deoxy-D-xylulose-5-phosphate reductoisomerase [Actinomycetota bacterium]
MRPTWPRRVVVLGSTGSVGRQALEVIQSFPDRFEAIALVAGSDGAALERQAAELGIGRIGLGVDAAVEYAQLEEADIVFNAIVGAAGLRASVAALETGRTLALANKESLVAGGEVCRAAAASGEGTIVPVDSEHSALAQCLAGRHPATVEKVILTASGGSLREHGDLDSVTPEEALAHPTWSMGPKITIDSATLMNKGLEVIEAHYLFGVPYDRIDVLLHRQSLVHGIVQMVDGSLFMHAATTDMRLPIQAALCTPDIWPSLVEPLDLATADDLTFEELDDSRWPAVKLAYRAGRLGGSAPAVLNAANEVSVQAFLERRIAFTELIPLVASVLDAHDVHHVTTIEDVERADAWARAQVAESLQSSEPEVVSR